MMVEEMSDLELVEGRLEGLKILLDTPANEKTMTDAELKFAIREVETIRDCMKITAEQQMPDEVLDRLCWADIVLLVQGTIEKEDVRFCKGESCNYCFKFGPEKHCGHECVCRYFGIGMGIYCHGYKCEHDTRQRKGAQGQQSVLTELYNEFEERREELFNLHHSCNDKYHEIDYWNRMEEINAICKKISSSIQQGKQAQPQDAAAGKAEPKCPYWSCAEPDDGSPSTWGCNKAPASPGKASDVLAELDKQVRAIKCQDEDLWLIELVLKKIAALRQVHQQ